MAVYTVMEGDTLLLPVVSDADKYTFTLDTSDGTAVSAAIPPEIGDYIPVSVSVTNNENDQFIVTYPVITLDDDVFEGSEPEVFYVDGTVHYTWSGEFEFDYEKHDVIYILDNDGDEPLHLSVSSAQVTETNDNTQTVTLTITANKAVESSYEISLSISLDGILAGADFFDPHQTAMMGANETSTTVTFTLRGDAYREPDEEFQVDVTSGVDYDPGQIQLINDDGPYLTIGSLTGSADKLLIYEQGPAGRIGIHLSESVGYAIDLNVTLAPSGWNSDITFSQHIVIPENTTDFSAPLAFGLADSALERPEAGTFTFTANALGSDEKVYFGLEGSGNRSASLEVQLRDVAQGILEHVPGMPEDLATASKWADGFQTWFEICDEFYDARKKLPEAQASKALGIVAQELGVVIDTAAIAKNWSVAYKEADRLDKKDPALADQLRHAANLQATEELASAAAETLIFSGVAYGTAVLAATFTAPVLATIGVGLAVGWGASWVYDTYFDPAIREAAGEAYLAHVNQIPNPLQSFEFAAHAANDATDAQQIASGNHTDTFPRTAALFDDIFDAPATPLVAHEFIT